MKTAALMRTVIAALLPVVVAAIYERGAGALLQVVLAIGGCLLFETLCLVWRRQPVTATLVDGTAIVAGIIIGLSLPPLTPWYVSIAASAFAMVLAKHCYGGLGNNPFNPAMAGYALALVSFPADFDGWATASVLNVVFGGADAISSPTPLTARQMGVAVPVITIIFPLSCIIGGAILFLRRAADWRLTSAFLLGVVLVGGADTLLAGGTLLAAFFVITDPATAAVTVRGKWLYGLTAGALVVWLRADGQHTDGIAFAILICNMLAPLMDRIVRWR
ncbi:RnfABCDGE type electron transport complex subunit D [Candidatus Persebacteraceae bacterium Df01]|jgi:electron transport complex protein RnfD|uniref:RnfABCDGE type electron transport complex subunit D n=1 Tax=Candidatus Doriopsillibacter californiensis TaxID=2970740 RepID=A0ABT7QN79_9GAMM|nr:RnfABCDGE type electron transport complex subunit D [Candidatus Persebacteraceae bacterium Df01]